jgi:hypothetical protein
MARLTFWDNKRASTNFLYVHIKGFVEPPRSIYPTGNEIIDATSINRTLTFNWNDFNVENPQWGDIIGYKVFYSTTVEPVAGTNAVNNIFLSVIPASGVLTSKTFSANLNFSTFYYVKIVPVRQINGKQYLSESNLRNLKILVAPSTAYYHAPNKILIDKMYQSDTPRNYSQAQSRCSSLNYNIIENGASKIFARSLMDMSAWQIIDNNPDIANSYPNGIDYLLVPHWINNSVTATTAALTPYGYNGVDLTFNETNERIYLYKSCTGSPTCDNIPRMMGGDTESLHDYTMYIAPQFVLGYARCAIKF